MGQPAIDFSAAREGGVEGIEGIEGVEGVEGAQGLEWAPAQDLDALEELGDEIATLAAHLHAATHRLLMLVAEFDRRGGWKNDGFRSCAQWLAFRNRSSVEYIGHQIT